MTAIRLPLAPTAFVCERLERTVAVPECASLARAALNMRGPKVERPCIACPIGEANMRGALVVEPRSPKNNAPMMVRVGDVYMTLSEAARVTGHDRRTLRWRHARGIPLDAPVTRGPRATQRAVVTATPTPAALIRQLQEAGYVATPEVRDGRSVLVVAWPEDAATGRQEAAE